ncbi:translation initiation factor IF-3 [Candidatus Dependentiae bacterium]|nr:translation initiation factor IF-3 [Candidatus Dependentiae bacterium]
MSRFKPRYNNKKSNNKLLANNYQVNEKIRASNVQVIDEKGENLGVLPKQEALRLAENAELDLVKVGEKGDMPITKIMDFGKFLYAKKKQLIESKKKHKIVQVKEIKMRPNIGENDYKTKLNRAIKFLNEGKKVKFTIQFRGREFIMIKELGRNFFERINKDLEEQNLGTLVEEKEQRGGPFWSKIYYLK